MNIITVNQIETFINSNTSNLGQSDTGKLLKKLPKSLKPLKKLNNQVAARAIIQNLLKEHYFWSAQNTILGPVSTYLNSIVNSQNKTILDQLSPQDIKLINMCQIINQLQTTGENGALYGDQFFMPVTQKNLVKLHSTTGVYKLLTEPKSRLYFSTKHFRKDILNKRPLVTSNYLPQKHAGKYTAMAQDFSFKPYNENDPLQTITQDELKMIKEQDIDSQLNNFNNIHAVRVIGRPLENGQLLHLSLFDEPELKERFKTLGFDTVGKLKMDIFWAIQNGFEVKLDGDDYLAISNLNWNNLKRNLISENYYNSLLNSILSIGLLKLLRVSALHEDLVTIISAGAMTTAKYLEHKGMTIISSMWAKKLYGLAEDLHFLDEIEYRTLNSYNASDDVEFGSDLDDVVSELPKFISELHNIFD
ncbi:hypothetical protein FC98_GL002040 [Lentilactobacillus kisonensis DSM 19906 = JCM 15041]|uniref:Uncharacterized protein n=1 Tax=Lentilactobacillus kisonensis DSM 19906 = JCM 15041 TaxID=1423766 RepID=A0A0R1NID5_9LACO|nr:hypothetical protein FC98_GL002040 [Lentilactobacillus kisonensis DSM 19906 = JCM 15041]